MNDDGNNESIASFVAYIGAGPEKIDLCGTFVPLFMG
jgi:hypothetical protein